MTTKEFTKIVRIGSGTEGNVYAKIQLSTAGNLSISGVEGPKKNGNCVGGCGQIVMHPWNIIDYAPGWTPALEAKFREVWNEWHLNDLTAGSPAQEAYLKLNPVIATFPESHYDKACASLQAAGLHPDTSYLHNGTPYLYGSAWLRVDVPDEVLDFLSGLPDTDITPAWV